MRWPFQSKKETDIRVFRDPHTDAITLRFIGPLNLPSEETPLLELTVDMNVRLDQEAVQRLYEQLSHFAKHEIEASS